MTSFWTDLLFETKYRANILIILLEPSLLSEYVSGSVVYQYCGVLVFFYRDAPST